MLFFSAPETARTFSNFKMSSRRFMEDVIALIDVHPVTTYRIVDLKQNLAVDEPTIRTQLPHLKVEVEPHLMSADEREQAASALRQALDRLL